MKARKLNNQAFTIVEIVIVLLIIGVLTTIIVMTYSGIQEKNRNSIRHNDLQQIQAKLEGFDSDNGYYPSLADMNNPAWRQKNLPGLNPKYMIDPSSKQTVNNVVLSATPKAGYYSYQVTDSNGNPCEKDDTNCAKYTLTAIYQGSYDGRHEYQLQNLD